MKIFSSQIEKLVYRDNGFFLLCGKSGEPALAVEAALKSSLIEGAGLSMEEGEALLEQLKSTRRFSEEVY